MKPLDVMRPDPRRRPLSSDTWACWTLAKAALFVVLSLAIGIPRSLALDPPRPGELEDLGRTGRLEERVNAAVALGNHRVDAQLVQAAIDRQLGTAGVAAGSTFGAAGPLHGAATQTGSMISLPAIGSPRVFALLIDFPDQSHAIDASVVDAKLFGAGGPAEAAFPHESMAGYYARSSYGQLLLYRGTTLGWYRSAHSRGSVPKDPLGRQALVKEALAHFANHDFSQYDNDGDGYIDYFIVVWSGPVGSWADFWWSYYTGWTDDSYVVDGKKLRGYSWQRELDGASFATRTAIHNTGHALGLPDLFDYSDSVGPPGGVGGFDMMDAEVGDHNGFSKWLLGWLTPKVVSRGSEQVTLNPSGSHPEAVLIMPQPSGVGGSGEFFLVQNRFRTGNDNPRVFTRQLSWTDGFQIWHVDARLNASATATLSDNSFTPHKLLRLMEADGLEEIETQSPSSRWVDAADVYTEGEWFGDGTFPSSRRFGGEPTGVLITDVARAGAQFSARFTIAGRAAAGSYHSLLVQSGNGLWAWGRNSRPQPGTGRAGDQLSPVRTVAGLDWRFASGGVGHTLAMRPDGSLWAWGMDSHGQVGDGWATIQRGPVQLSSDTPWATADAGDFHSVGLKADGTLWAWGYNRYGQLGLGHWNNTDSPARIGSRHDWAFVAAGGQHSVAISTDGTLWAWGGNGSGQLGLGSYTDRSTPVRVGSDQDWVMAAAGLAHTLALKRDGSLWAWGNNDQGQLGTGTRMAFNQPVRVGSDGDWAMVTAGGGHSAALKRDGSLWVWGSNTFGELGLNSTEPARTSPTRVGTATDWDFVAAGSDHTLAIRTDATLWGAGRNNAGQLGDGTTKNSRFFRQVLSTLPAAVNLATVPPGPRQLDARVTVIASASGGTARGGEAGAFEYQFWLKRGTAWSLVQDFSRDRTWDWDTTGLAAGTYAVMVAARNAGSVAPSEATVSQELTLLSVPATAGASTSTRGAPQAQAKSKKKVPASVSIVASSASPQVVGASVLFTAGVTGGTGSYEYQFRRWDAATKVWTTVRAYSTAGTWTWDTTGATEGSYLVTVWARRVRTKVAYELYKSIDYALTAPPVTAPTSPAAPAVPQAAGKWALCVSPVRVEAGDWSGESLVSVLVAEASAGAVAGQALGQVVLRRRAELAAGQVVVAAEGAVRAVAAREFADVARGVVAYCNGRVSAEKGVVPQAVGPGDLWAHFVARTLTEAEIAGLLRFVAAEGYRGVIIEVGAWFRSVSLPETSEAGALDAEGWGRVARLGRALGLVVVPEVKLLTHQQKLLGLSARYAPLRINAYTYDPGNPEVRRLVTGYLDEVLGAFGPGAVHIGHDEAARPGREHQPLGPGDAVLTAAQFVDSVVWLEQLLAARGVETWMWADMLLDPKRFPGLPEGEQNGVGAFASAASQLPRSVVLMDWHYYTASNCDVAVHWLRGLGFRVMTAGWWRSDALACQFGALRSDPPATRAQGQVVTTWYYVQQRDWPKVQSILTEGARLGGART